MYWDVGIVRKSTITLVQYRILMPFGPLTSSLWHGPWPRPLVWARVLSPLSHGPRPHATMLDLRHIGLVILAQAHLEVQSGPCSVNCVLDMNMIARGTMSRLPSIALGNIATKQPLKGGNQFQYHYYHYQQNIHLETMELDPHFHL